jgi:hypothetical protein
MVSLRYFADQMEQVYQAMEQGAGYSPKQQGFASDLDDANTPVQKRRAGYVRQLATVGGLPTINLSSRPRDSELDQVNHIKQIRALRDVDELDEVHHSRTICASALNGNEAPHRPTGADCPEFYSSY